MAGLFLECPPGRLGINQRIGINLVSKISMLWAGFLDINLAVLNKISPDYNRAAIMAERFDSSGQSAKNRVNQSSLMRMRRASGPFAFLPSPYSIMMNNARDLLATIWAVKSENHLFAVMLEYSWANFSAKRASGLSICGQVSISFGKPSHLMTMIFELIAAFLRRFCVTLSRGRYNIAISYPLYHVAVLTPPKTMLIMHLKLYAIHNKFI
jgi:hypothetical protein